MLQEHRKIPSPSDALLARFLSRITRATKSGCHEWVGRKTRGYGKFSIGHNQYLAHRVSYAWQVGEIGQGFLVCHKCDNPSCVNPDHLYLGKDADNVRDRESRGRNGYSGLSHCKYGHPFDSSNTYQAPRDGVMRRGCRACRRRNKVAYRAVWSGRAMYINFGIPARAPKNARAWAV